jgi:histidinol dehydrogenase
MIRIYSAEDARDSVLRRSPWEEQEMPSAVSERIARVFGEALGPEAAVSVILRDVRMRGDAAVREWSERLDGSGAEQLAVPKEEWRAAYERLAPRQREAMDLAAERIRAFHERQPIGSWVDAGSDGILGQLVRPLARVGVYVPGGTAPLPSSLLMAAIPARVAGVREIVCCTPPAKEGRISDQVLAAAHRAGVDALYMVGGAQAIAALAYGTDSIAGVDKIVGAGGLFVTLAKRQVFGRVGIDGFYGPTETLVIADESANAAWVAADLLAQAEHDVLASPLLLTPSEPLARRVETELAAQLESLDRAEIAAAALQGRGGIVITRDLQEAVMLSNQYAPEHLCLLVREPWSLVGSIQNAGGIFVGDYSFEVLGDYVAGPSHVMPTEGTARYSSPLSVADFVKRISLVALSPEAGVRLSAHAAEMARGEGLTAHAAAAEKRRA